MLLHLNTRGRQTQSKHFLHATQLTSDIVQSPPTGATPAFYMKIPACSNHPVSPSAKQETEDAAVSKKSPNSTLCPIFHSRPEVGIWTFGQWHSIHSMEGSGRDSWWQEAATGNRSRVRGRSEAGGLAFKTWCDPPPPHNRKVGWDVRIEINLMFSRLSSW